MLYSAVPYEFVHDHCWVLDKLTDDDVPHGVKMTCVPAAVFPLSKSRHIKLLPLMLGFCVMMGADGRPVPRHAPASQAPEVPMYAPLQHMAYPAYPYLGPQYPPLGGTANVVPSSDPYVVEAEAQPCV